jgi:hypothetical protein
MPRDLAAGKNNTVYEKGKLTASRDGRPQIITSPTFRRSEELIKDEEEVQ